MGWLMIVNTPIMVYIIGVLTISLLLWLLFGTNYKIGDGRLKIKSGPFRSTVNIEDIKSMNATKTLLAGPALSVDRIEIFHKEYDLAIVSPKDKKEFGISAKVLHPKQLLEEKQTYEEIGHPYRQKDAESKKILHRIISDFT